MDNFENEIPKYQKKSTRQPPKKFKHKHKYKQCLIMQKDKQVYDKLITRYHLAEYCIICGKIGDIKFFESEPYGEGYARILTNEEVLEKHKDLEVFEVSDIWSKYVTIVK